MSSLTLRNTKGSPLTIEELDHNFEYLLSEINTKANVSDITAQYILTQIKSVDGSTSGLDADTIDGYNTATAPSVNTVALRDNTGSISAISFNGNLTGDVTGNVTGNVSGTASDITGILSINKGGTGSSSSSQALNNLLPSGEQPGYILKTNGEGSYFWGQQTGNVTTAGTRVDSTRTTTIATANQTVFTAPSYIAGTNQLRVYINGVRQFDSAYTETSSTSFTLDNGVTAGTEVLAEVDGYIEYDTAASEVTYSPSGIISSTNVQDAIEEVGPYVVPAGGIILWSGSSSNIPSGWALCDGTNGTPNLVDKFVVGATGSYNVGGTGGSKDAIVPAHTHTSNYSDNTNYLKYVEMSDATGLGSTSITVPESGWSPWIQTGRRDGGNRWQRFQNSGTTLTTRSLTTNSTGSSATDANLPPYYALCYIMKL